jgi:hypothetical protein
MNPVLAAINRMLRLMGNDNFVGPVGVIPVGRKEMIRVYGDPAPRMLNGKLVCSPEWESDNCVVVSAKKIPGYHRPIYMHELVKPYFIEAMRRAVAACPEYRFEKIGCFNPRHQQYDEDRPLSDHAWAIAFDINPGANSWVPEKDHPKPFEAGWSEFSDLPRGVVAAFESVGFEWGGRWKHRDTMHFSLRRTS